MGARGVLEIHTPVEKLVRLDVAVVVGLAYGRVVVLLREEARRSQYEAGEPVSAMKKLAEILRRDLGHAVDIPRNRPDVLGHPDRGRPGRRRQYPAEGAGRAGEHKGGNADRRGFLEQVERARDIRVDEV